MGACGSSKEQKADQPMGRAGQQGGRPQQKVTMDSELIQLFTASGLKLIVHKLDTAQMVLQKAAEQLGLPKAAARWLRMQFSEAVVAHDQTMQAAGLHDGAQFVLLDKEKAEAMVEAAKSVDLFDAAARESSGWAGRIEEVEACCVLYPERVHAKDMPRSSRCLIGGQTPLHYAASNNSVKVAELLIAAGASVEVKTIGGQTPLQLASIHSSVQVSELLIAAGATPDVEEKKAVTAVAVLKEPTAKPAAANAKPTILLIDDAKVLLNLQSMELAGHGLDVTTACGASEGLQLLKARQFALVLCDIQMVGMNGCELTESFRTWEKANRGGGSVQHIVALTGYANDEVSNECQRVGMAHVLTKPLEISNVFDLLASLHPSPK